MVDALHDPGTSYDATGMIERDCTSLDPLHPRGPRYASEWVDLNEDVGVLDVWVPSVGLALSLFIVRPPFPEAETVCWWTTQSGDWLGEVYVGTA